MLNRYVFEALTRGHRAFRASGNALYEDLFGRIFTLQPSEVSTIAGYFEKNPVRILHGYPRDEIDHRPACYIYLMGEQQPGFALADFGTAGAAPVVPVSAIGVAATGQQGAPSNAAFILSSLWTHQYQILGLARGSPEPVMWLTEINKAILLAAKQFFLERAMQSVVLSASDVQFREDLAPADLFARAITLQCGREFSQADTSRALQDAFQLPGLIGPPGSDTHPPGRATSHVIPLNPQAATNP